MVLGRKDVLVRPQKTIKIGHRAYFLRSAPHQPSSVAASEEGRISFLSFRGAARHSIKRRSKISAVSLHPKKPLLAMVESGRLTVIQFNGSSVFKEVGLGARQGTTDDVCRGFDDCFFDESGDYLWCSAARSRDEVEVQLRRTSSWSTVNTALINDPFGQSSCSFHGTSWPDVVALWLAAEQDGQQVYWLRRQAVDFRCDLERKLKNTIPPAFSPSGAVFWVVNQDGVACRFEYPQVRQTGAWQSPAEEDPFDCSLCCLDDRYALVGSLNGRVLCWMPNAPPSWMR